MGRWHRLSPQLEKALTDSNLLEASPFRDWLRHTGQYDADSGKYAGDGAPASLVGEFVTLNGQPRSPFYDNRTPDEGPVGGKSFNDTFSTDFTTWDLAYWDLDRFPDAITDTGSDPTRCSPQLQRAPLRPLAAPSSHIYRAIPRAVAPSGR